MKILTGADRLAYERLLAGCARCEAERDQAMFHMKLAQDDAAHWRTRAEQERLRAERAVDTLLEVRGFPPITPATLPPTLPDLLAEEAGAVAEIEARLAKGDASVFAEWR